MIKTTKTLKHLTLNKGEQGNSSAYPLALDSAGMIAEVNANPPFIHMPGEP